MTAEILIISAFAGLFLVALGAAMIWAASISQQRHRYHDLDYLKLVLRSVGASVVTFGVLSWLVLLLGLALQINRGALNPGVVLLIPLWLIFGLAGFSGVGALRAASSLRPEMTEIQIFELERRLTLLKSAGWCLVVLAFFSSLLPLGALLIVFIVAAAAVSGGSLRAKQSSLLWQLALCAERDLPLADEIEALAYTFSGRYQVKAKRLAEELRNGKPLPAALRELPGLVPQQALLAIEVGAETGTLPQSLRESAQRQSSRLIAGGAGIGSPGGLVLYWSALMCVLVSIVGFLAYAIVPKFRRIFEDFNVDPGTVAQMLFQTSDTAASTLALCLPLALLPLLAVYGLVIGQFYGWDSIPTWKLGRFFLRLDTPGILRGLSRAVASQQPLDASIDRLAEAHRRSSVRERLHKIFYAIKRGESCWAAMQQQRLITQHEHSVIQAAERAGNLPWALQHLAENMERQFDHRLGQLGEVLQPVFVICMGLVVLVICVGVFFPIVQLMQSMN